MQLSVTCVFAFRYISTELRGATGVPGRGAASQGPVMGPISTVDFTVLISLSLFVRELEGRGERGGGRRKPATSSLKLSGRQPAVKLAAASPAGELSRAEMEGRMSAAQTVPGHVLIFSEKAHFRAFNV